MKKIWHDQAWEDYLNLQNDKKLLKKANALLKDIERGGYEGIGKPEPLKGNLSGYWSRRIDDYNRIVYRIYSENQAYNGEDENRMYFCPQMKIVPDGFFANARKLLEAQNVDEIKETVLNLLKTTRSFILERKPLVANCDSASDSICDTACASDSKINFQGLADWYQELSLTWRRLRYFCKNNMVEKAYIDACYLQEEFLYIAQEYKIDELNLLDSFDKENLSLLADRSNQLEKIIQDILAEHGIKINSYSSVKDFLSKRG